MTKLTPPAHGYHTTLLLLLIAFHCFKPQTFSAINPKIFSDPGFTKVGEPPVFLPSQDGPLDFGIKNNHTKNAIDTPIQELYDELYNEHSFTLINQSSKTIRLFVVYQTVDKKWKATDWIPVKPQASTHKIRSANPHFSFYAESLDKRKKWHDPARGIKWTIGKESYLLQSRILSTKSWQDFTERLIE
jgi:hypothetical protein